MATTDTCAGGCGEPTSSTWATEGGHDLKLVTQMVRAMGCADDTEGRLALKALVEHHTGFRIDCNGVYK